MEGIPFISDEERKGLLYGSLISAGLAAASGRSVADAVLRGFSGLGSAYTTGLNNLYAERQMQLDNLHSQLKAQIEQERIKELIQNNEEKRKQIDETQRIVNEYLNKEVGKREGIKIPGTTIKVGDLLSGLPEIKTQEFSIPERTITKWDTLTPEQKMVFKMYMATGQVPQWMQYILPKEEKKEEEKYVPIGTNHILNIKTGEVSQLPTKPKEEWVVDPTTGRIRHGVPNEGEVPLNYYSDLQKSQKEEASKAASKNKEIQQENEKKVDIIMKGTHERIQALLKGLGVVDPLTGMVDYSNLPENKISEINEILTDADDKIQKLTGMRPYGTREKNPSHSKSKPLPITPDQAKEELRKRGWPIK